MGFNRADAITGNGLLALAHELGIPYAKTDFLGDAVVDKPILVTHNGGYNILDGHGDTVAITSVGIAHFVPLPGGLRWLCQNCETTRPLCEGLPLGLENFELPACASGDNAKHFNTHGNGDQIVAAVEQVASGAYGALAKRSPKVFCAWRSDTAPYERGLARLALEGQSWVDYHNADIDNERRLSPPEYIRELAAHEFCACPEGNGIDCHRVWESLYLGVIPIVRRSRAMLWFADLPIMFVDSWDEVHPANLDLWRRALSGQSREQLSLAWWRRYLQRALELV